MTARREVSEQSWMADAACAGADPDLFFPQRGGDSAAQVAAAKRVCAGCPVRQPCLEWGNHEPFGVFGGLSPLERRDLRMGRPTACSQGHRFDESNPPRARADGSGYRCAKCLAAEDRRRAERKRQLGIVRSNGRWVQR